MVKFGVGQSIARVEDDRLITGQGQFAGDVSRPNQAFAVLVRSPHAHARLGEIDVSEAKAAPGVLGVYTGEDVKAGGLGTLASPAADMLRNRDGSEIYRTYRPILAIGHVRYVGDPIALVVAETEAQARDAAELVMADYEDLPAVVDTEGAIEEGAPVVWPENGSNLAYEWELGDKDAVEAALASAAHVTRIRLINNRIVVNAMEPRAAVGEYDAAEDRYTLYSPSQGVYGLRNNLANYCLQIPPEKLRVITNDVGGGFGMKTFMYAEYPLVLWAAKQLGRPVKWTGDRSESFLSDTQGRDHVTNAALALDENGKFLGVEVLTIANLGAYQSQFGPFIPTLAARGMHVGVYDMPALYNNVRPVYTNTVPVDAYRGAGRPEASYVIERLVDQAAREIGLSPAELRRRNFLKPDQMPVNQKPRLPFDSGDFDRNLTDALKLADVDGFEARRAEKAKQGLYAGLGIAYYVERTAAGMSDYARVVIDGENGKVHLHTGQQTNGQGHETVWTQVLCSRLGVDAEDIVVHHGDTNILPGGAGTGGSKAVYLAPGAITEASEDLISKGRQVAANELEAAVHDIEFRGADGQPVFAVTGTDKVIDLYQVAKLAAAEPDLGEFAGDGEYNQKQNTFPNGAHICEIEIDPETGVVRLVNFTSVDDFGNVLNPLIVAGQVHGGIVQGLGQAMGEQTVYDETGQLVTGSFQDYWMPRADDLPSFKFAYNEIPAHSNELGAKGAGEAGTVGAPAAYMNAVIDALKPIGVSHVDMPVTPQKIWSLISKAQAAE